MRRSWRLFREAEPRRGWRTAAALVVVFAALTLVTRYWCTDQAHNASVWPANAALVAALLVLPRGKALATLAACLAVNLLLNAWAGYALSQNVLIVGLNLLVSACAAFLTRNLCGAALDLSRFRRLATFAAIALVSAGCEAFAGYLLQPVAPRGTTALTIWSQWTFCDALGLVLATPALLLVVKSRRGGAGAYEARALERVLLLVISVTLSALAFTWSHWPLYLMVYPMLVLVAFRAGPAWVLSSVLIVSMVVSGLTTHGHGPLVVMAADGGLFRQDLVQPYLASLFLSTIPANNALGEKIRAARRLRRVTATMEHGATHDALTTLVNRKFFKRRLTSLLLNGAEAAVMFIDLDRFKQVNDSFGHEAGDELLRAFALRLISSTPEDATVARFGGDEFAVLVADVGDDAALDAVCARINAAARAPFPLSRGPAHVGASIGVARSHPGVDAHELMRRADIALYAAKAAGRDDRRLFTDELDLTVRERAGLEADLRAALDSGQGLLLHYQPKIERDGAMRGVEALVRWRHPREGMIPPGRFISIAEESGLITRLGAWVLGEAAAFAARRPDLHVAVNVSPVQLRQPQFVADALGALAACGVSPDRIEVEVTESALLDELHPTAAGLKALRAAGVRIALDDFGTGYSSLRHLHRFAVDRVKIDQSFVMGLGEGGGEPAAIIQAIIQLGHAMGLQVTAEGVETEDQLRHLVRAGVDELQGFFFARPMDEEALPAPGETELAAAARIRPEIRSAA